MPRDIHRTTYPVATLDDDSWPIRPGSVGVDTPHGIVVAYSPAGLTAPYTNLRLVHGGAVHVGQLNEHRSPSELARLARRFASEVARLP